MGGGAGGASNQLAICVLPLTLDNYGRMDLVDWGEFGLRFGFGFSLLLGSRHGQLLQEFRIGSQLLHNGSNLDP